VSVFIFASMLITCIDKIKNSVCRSHCGFLLGHTKIFNPINYIMTITSRIFPIDYILYLLLTMLFFASSVVGMATIGIRFLWITLFRIRKGQTTPNAMLMATVLLTLIVLALNPSATSSARPPR
jgi:LMBR1 domain-containing protein 1